MTMIWMTKRNRNHVRFQLLSLTPVINIHIAKKKRATAATLGNPTATDADGFLEDIDVQAVDEGVKGPSREDRRRDVDNFFHPNTVRIVNGKGKTYRVCKVCP